MAPKPKPWFRFYCEAMHDRKLRRLTPAQRWTWVAVLCSARQSPKPGLLLVGTDPMGADDLADIAGVSLKDARSALDAFVNSGMLFDDHGVLCVTAWEKRQYESDTSTARVRKHRNDQETSMERPIAVPETLLERPQSTETETDTETAERLLVNDNGTRDRASIIEAAAALILDRRVPAGEKPESYRAAARKGIHRDLVASLQGRRLEGSTPEMLANEVEPPPGPKLREINGRQYRHVQGTGFVEVSA